MRSKMEELSKLIYGKWKADCRSTGMAHPDENVLACYVEEKLEKNEKEAVKEHLLNCDSCSQAVALVLSIKPAGLKPVPEELARQVKELVLEEKPALLEILLKLKNRTWEIIQSNADVLLGQELIPAAVLRSRQSDGIREEITLLKNFKQLRVELRLNNKESHKFNMLISVKDKTSHKSVSDLRVALFKDEVELESHASDSGSVIFEDVAAGKCRVEIFSRSNAAVILLEVKV